jgi:hypothetical protein
MFANEKPLSRFEVSAIISICVVLFIAAFSYPGNDPIRPHRRQFPRRAHSPPEARELAVSSGTER